MASDEWEDIPENEIQNITNNNDGWEDIEDQNIISNKKIPVEEKTGKLEAATLGAARGATFGLSDAIGGAAGALGQLIGGDSEITKEAERKMQELGIEDPDPVGSLLDTYYAAKKDTAERSDKAAEDQPMSYLGGNIGGSLLGVGLAGKAAKGLSKLGTGGKVASKLLPSAENITGGSKLGNLARFTSESAKAGALGELAQGDSRLLEGDIQGTGKELEKGIVEGAGLGLGLGAAGMATKGAFKTIKNLPVIQNKIDNFKKGLKGISLKTKGGVGTKGDLKRELDRADELSQNLREYGVEKKGEIGSAMNDILDAEQTKINMNDIVNKYYTKLGKIDEVTETARLDKDKLYRIVETIDEGVDLQNMSAKEARQLQEDLINKVTDFGDGKAEIVTNEIADLARKMSKEITENIQNNVKSGEYKKLSDTYSKVQQMMESAGFKNKVDRNKITNEVERFANKIISSADIGKSPDAAKKVERAVEFLKQVNPAKADELLNNIKETQTSTDLVKRTTTDTSNLLRKLDQSVDKAMNTMGMGVKNTKEELQEAASPLLNQYRKSIESSKDIVKDKVNKTSQRVGESLNKNFNKFVSAKPEIISELSEEFAKKGASDNVAMGFSKVLKDLTKMDDQKRTATMYSLYQQPGFRKYMQDMGLYELIKD